MNASVRFTGTVDSRGRASRAGVTLLEVLVACGILVVGLASVASILPAAGARLGQATLEDRAGTLAVNAHADIVNRGLVSVDVFGSGTMQTAAFGQWPPDLRSASPAMLVSSTAVAPAVMQARLDPIRGPALEDDLVYTQTGLADTPANSFFKGAVGLGPREYRPGVCWAALLAPASFPAAAGGAATLSVAIFRKPPESVTRLVLNGAANSDMFQFSSGVPANDEAIRRQFLPGCGYVLALPANAGTSPQWIRITSSWTASGMGPAAVVLDLVPLGGSAAGLVSNQSMTVLAFENLVRVDQYFVTLE